MEGGPSFSLGNRLFRLFFSVCWTVLASWTPPPFHGWRRFLLTLFGANIHRTARIHASVRVWYPPYLSVGKNTTIGPRVTCYCQDRITIGDRAVVSQGAHLCAGTHSISDENFQLVTRPIDIEDQVWVAAECFIGPGVRIGQGAVLGARGVAFKDLKAWTVYAGNPAREIKIRTLNNHRSPISER